jgi:hypothetical protein
MAARPVLAALNQQLIRHARQAGIEATASGEAEALEHVLHHIIEGKTVTDVARELGCTRGLLYGWFKQRPERWDALVEARRLAAHVMMDDAHDKLEGADSVTISVIREQVKFKQWLAERYNRAELGDQKTLSIEHNLSAQHLKALDELMALPAPSAPLLALEAEIVSVDERD